MLSRRAITVSTLTLAVLALASCAKKHSAARTPNPPRVQSGEIGIASWYGHPYHGRPAANGEIYDMETFTAAHRTLPFGTWVRVVNLTNAKTVDVRIIDRGPFVEHRIIDLSHAAAEAIELIGPGVGRVRLDILSVPSTSGENWYAVQVGAFVDPARAERLRASLEHDFRVPGLRHFGACWWDAYRRKKLPGLWLNASANNSGARLWCVSIHPPERRAPAGRHPMQHPKKIRCFNMLGCCRNPKVLVEFIQDQGTTSSDNSATRVLNAGAR